MNGSRPCSLACQLFLAGLCGVLPAAATTAARADSPELGTLNLVIENDAFAGRDQDYTNGVLVSWTSGPDQTPAWAATVAHWLPFFSDQGTVRLNYGVGQSMYTPDNLAAKNPPGDDHPYAGWLYGSVGLFSQTDRQLDQLQLQLGVVGPAALAEQAQDWAHGILGDIKPQGWDHQLDNEPGIVLTYQRSWRLPIADDLMGLSLDATPHLGAALGNVFTYANGGATLRLGWNMPNDYGPPRIEPSLPASGYYEPQADFGWYLFAGVDGRAVARNIFLDGNSFEDSASVEKNILVGDAQAGIALVFRAARLAYTHVFRSQEYKGQHSPDKFGALSLSLRF